MDRTVLLQAANGNQASWRRLVEHYSPRIYALVWSKCKDHDIAEDVSQEAFMKLVRRLHGFSDLPGFEAWLFTVARNAMLDRLRKRKRWAKLVTNAQTSTDNPTSLVDLAPDAAPTPAQRAEHRETLDRLRAWVAELGEKDREILHLRHTAQLKYEQIAKILGEPVGTVLARSHRAIKKLKQKMIDASIIDTPNNTPRLKTQGGNP